MPTRNLSTDQLSTSLPLTMEVRSMRIKMGVRWFPWTIFSTPRQSGKTTALLEIIYEDHGGNAIYFCQSEMSAHAAAHLYRKLFTPNAQQPLFVASTDYLKSHTRGTSMAKWPIYCDEWWLIRQEEQDRVLDTCRVVGRVGTES